MKILNIEIKNFRQYHNTVSVDLTTDSDQNIILIGGKNGYGKTNFLISIVWCLYGRLLERVDNNFKQEIKKEKNYDSFMLKSLNWTAENEGQNEFSVSIVVDDIELPELDAPKSKNNSVRITRTFNISNRNENISIIDTLSNSEMFDNEDDKTNFINDYIIPIDAAKFVFFDAEKISEIANLSMKEEGSFINDALSKILGLDIYDTLIEDIEFYINNLKKEGASKNLKEEILDKEKAIELFNFHIDKYEEENATKLKKISDLRKEINHHESLISQYSKQGGSSYDRESILLEIESFKNKQVEFAEKFNELSEIVPLAMLTGNLEEVNEHLSIQEKNDNINNSTNEIKDKVDKFIDLLFNHHPIPDNSSMSFDDKLFYLNKAQNVSAEIFNNYSELQDLEFEHDLNNAEKKLITDALNLLNSQSKEIFENTINEFNEVQIKLTESTRILNKIDADLEDDLVSESYSLKDDAISKVDQLNIAIGENIQKTVKAKVDINKLKQQLETLIKKTNINEKNMLKIREADKYIAVLSKFIEDQKVKHKESLEKTILNELKRLMHKLGSDENHNKLIEDVEVIILPSDQGMKIRLLDQNDNEIRKESLSSGEKQIYISSLIKAILNESIQSLPIFIDTPLGRLDEEHRDNITKKYYPVLSEQVVLFSTNSEITPKRYRDISSNISKSYLLLNDGVNTIIENGYFKNI